MCFRLHARRLRSSHSAWMASLKLPATGLAAALQRFRVLPQALNACSLSLAATFLSPTGTAAFDGHPGRFERSRPTASLFRNASIRPVRILLRLRPDPLAALEPPAGSQPRLNAGADPRLQPVARLSRPVPHRSSCRRSPSGFSPLRIHGSTFLAVRFPAPTPCGANTRSTGSSVERLTDSRTPDLSSLPVRLTV